MEAYFHNDPRVREWVDQITENIFTVCLLSGVESDAEFKSGCQIVMKIVSLLQEIPTIPSEFLEDGVKQLLEQQLPDKRVIENFPAYKATMDRMLRESILMVLDQNKKAFTIETSKEEIVEPIEEITQKHYDNGPEMHVPESNEELLTESAISALSTNCIHQSKIRTGDVVFATVVKVEAEAELDQDDSSEPPIPILDNTNMSGTKPVADEVKHEPLKRVLSNIFPNSIVYWNKSLMGQAVLAQVEDILICLHDVEQPISLQKFYKEGWKVLVCNTEDLTFPRRLERGIRRQIQRSGN